LGKENHRIVSCSEDRNAYVWTLKDGSFKPVLVILRINRCATDVKWSPEENKFAVASGAKCVSVCYFEEDNDWWVSKHIKKHKSTVLKVDWHPNNVLLATASSDFKCRIFSAYIKMKGVDSAPPQTPFGNKLTFGECFAEFDAAMGWVHSVQWSPSGNKLAFVGHDSILAVADVTTANPKVEVVKHSDLPFQDLLWTAEDGIVAVGHDCNPTFFQNKGGWKLVKKLDTGSGAAASADKGPSAFKTFQNKVDKAETSTETKLNTKHQNVITYVVAYKRAGNTVSQFSTTGMDGALGIWDASK